MATHYQHHAYHSRKKRSRRWLFLLLVLAGLAGYIYIALNRPLPAGTVQIQDNIVAQVDTAQIVWPEAGYAAIGTLNDGVLASSHQDDQPRPIASLTKVITALAVLEKLPLQLGETGMTITLDKEDEKTYWEYVAKEGTVTAVTAGEQINQYQSLQAMLLPSSNNMSDSLVRRVFGSMDAYTQYANDMVKRYGLTKTHIADASGFSPQTVSTPAEMIIIGQKALEHPVIAEIVAQEEAEIPIAGVIPNYNGFLRLEGVTGIKPGNTDEAGNCLLFSAKYQNDSGEDVTIIGVVLGIHELGKIYDQSAVMLKSTQASLRQVELIRGGQQVGTYTTLWGDRINLVAQESMWSYNLPSDSSEADFELLKTKSKITANQPVGSLRLGEDSDAAVQVVAKASVEEPSLLWRLTRPALQVIGYFK